MTDTTTKILVRNAREQDIPAVVEIDTEAFSSYGTAEKPETFQLRLTAFPNGFIILVADNEIAAFGCSEKWLTEREPGLDEDPLTTHQPDGRVFYITAMAVKTKYLERGFKTVQNGTERGISLDVMSLDIGQCPAGVTARKWGGVVPFVTLRGCFAIRAVACASPAQHLLASRENPSAP